MSNNGVFFFEYFSFFSWIVLWVYIRFIKCSWIHKRDAQTHEHTNTLSYTHCVWRDSSAKNPYLTWSQVFCRDHSSFLNRWIKLKQCFRYHLHILQLNRVSFNQSELCIVLVYLSKSSDISLSFLKFKVTFIQKSNKMPGRPLWQVRVAC